MNLLAHAFLSPVPPYPPGVLVGNMTADFIKGRARLAFAPDIRTGFALHQRIDAFTDIHPRVHACSNLLDARWGRYSTILVDIFFDHCLAVRWPGPVAFADFVDTVYGILAQHHAMLPPRAAMAVSAMISDDWLRSYATLAGIALSLSRLSRRLRERTGHAIDLAPAAEDLARQLPEFLAAFDAFFPELSRHVSTAPTPALIPLP